MNVSSRTPEGAPHRCPICDAGVVIEPSILVGDAPCPRCGSLLWFFFDGENSWIYERGEHFGLRRRLIDVVAEQLGVSPEKVANNAQLFDEIGADSLDKVELLIELQEEFRLYP